MKNEIVEDDLITRIQAIVDNVDVEGAVSLCSDYHYVDILEALDEMDTDPVRIFMKMLPYEDVAGLLENSWDDFLIMVTPAFTNAELINIFTYMAKADVADLLGFLSTVRRKEILRYMKSADSNILNMILSFDAESCGGIMTTEFIALKENLTVRQALLKLKDIAPKTEIIDYLLVTDNRHRLQGVIDLRDLLVAEDDTLLKDLFEDFPFYVHAEDDQEEASNMITKYDLNILPVVSKSMAVLGVITSEDIIAVIDQEYTEDILAMSGVNAEEEFDSEFFESFKNRFPWLVVNLFTAFLAASVVGLFSATIDTVVALSAAMPIVTGMGGNSGNQTLSIVLTSIARGDMALDKDFKLIMKEIGLALINGALLGAGAGIVLAVKYANPFLGVIMFSAMILNFIVAGVTGFLIPLLLDKMKMDPAVASSIFLTTFTDTCGFFIFLGLATIFLPKLI
ncbi:magnesium transporter [Peptoniphilus equinus]|uniref:Magnesium transporter MgtE n=1 Tax=Peptoniphilus equinus TaxID=3016343 RepID=A0ABY7QUB3_9FIRM|nr:magnesium transporter [Peptoniphilus equinus]WBW49483.1 magnesium transporter [Peptoniphilus equinus]